MNFGDALVHLDEHINLEATIDGPKAGAVHGLSLDRMRGIRGCDQELARHAADPRAGGAVRPAFDDDRTRALRVRGAVGRHAGRAGADDGDVNL